MQDGLLERIICQYVIAHLAFIVKNQRQGKRKGNVVCGCTNNGPSHLMKTEIMDLPQAQCSLTEDT